MQYKIKQFASIALFVTLFIAKTVETNAQSSEKNAIVTDPVEVAKLRAAVEANPNDLTAHQEYIKAADITGPEFEKRYENWMKQFPKTATIPFAIGEVYWKKELPKAKPYLLKAVELDPTLAKVYYYLWIDAERWGDFAGGREYLAKAIKADPANADYAFYYASSFKIVDLEKYRTMSLDVAKRFPTSERGAQALYWLGYRFTDPEIRIGFYEQLRNNFSPDKFSWSSSGMSGYFDLLLEVAPEKAVALAQSMTQTMNKEEQKTTWANQEIVARNIVRAKELLAQNKAEEAVTLLSTTRVSRWSNAKTTLALLKSKAFDAAGKTAVAYDSLKIYFAKEPEKEIGNALKNYGVKLGKNSDQIEADIWYVRDTMSKVATPFTLKRYLTPGSASLSDFQGKVVLLTYWFPGCGPCRGEFPHFENVIRKFKGKNVEYIGINIFQDQNDYVIPFMKTSGYSFTPLEDFPDRKKGTLDNRRAAPVNFLIDQKGRIMFSNFRTNEHNEDVLESMIASLLNRKANTNEIYC